MTTPGCKRNGPCQIDEHGRLCDTFFNALPGHDRAPYRRKSIVSRIVRFSTGRIPGEPRLVPHPGRLVVAVGGGEQAPVRLNATHKALQRAPGRSRPSAQARPPSRQHRARHGKYRGGLCAFPGAARPRRPCGRARPRPGGSRRRQGADSASTISSAVLRLGPPVRLASGTHPSPLSAQRGGTTRMK